MSEANGGGAVTIVIFGASGDLTERKLVPALFALYRAGRLPEGTRIVGNSRRPYSPEEFREHLRAGVQKHAAAVFDAGDWERFAPSLFYVSGDASVPEDYERLRECLRRLGAEGGNHLYYLATPPSLYAPTVARLGEAGMAREDGPGERPTHPGWRRIVVEKPFGTDLESARALNGCLHAAFDEHQIYRIDHYLGKETAQNILFFRFANAIWEPIWKRNYVDSVQITVAESLSVEHRGAYYDKAGVLRDMFQNHLLQLLTLVAMEPPISFHADAVRNEKAKVLNAIRPIAQGDTVRGQYRGYRQEPNVAPDSQTATYGALKLYVDTWRWRDVPFYLRSGKCLARKSSTIAIQFQCPPPILFAQAPTCNLMANLLTLCIQPDEGIHLSFETKVPGSTQEMRSVEMDFHYRQAFTGERLPEAYERLLMDALNGDQSLFTRADEVEAAWKLIDPVIQGWHGPNAPELQLYERGTWGPECAEELVGRDGRIWRFGCPGGEACA